jgi:Na+/melibiose symporter-like transporter
MSMTRTGETGSKRRWLVPGLCVVIAAAYTAVFLAHDRPLAATIGAAVMLAYAAVLVVFSRRSEAVALLREDQRDERRAMITTRAAATTLYVLVLLALTMVFVQLARGLEPGPWGVVCGVGGLTFIVATVYHSRRY